jgi:chromosome segregation ATPase
MLKHNNEALKSWMESADRLQSRYEELRKAMHDIKATIKTHERTEKAAATSRDRAFADAEKLRTQNAELSSQLTATLALLRDEKPNIESLWSENTELKKKLVNANNKIEAMEKETAFAREQYQSASTATYEMRRDMEELKISNAHLQRLADERVVKVQKERQMAAVEARDLKIEELAGQLKEREDRIQKLEHREGPMQGMKRSVPRRVGSPAQSRGSSPNLAALRRSEA